MRDVAAHFAAPVDAGGGLVLRPLTHADMPAIMVMFADADVARWYNTDPAEIADHIGAADIWPYLVALAGKPIGYLQTYHANADDFWRRLGVPAETFGLDMFLAEHREQGLGSLMTRAMIGHVWLVPEAVRVQIDPDPANARAVRAYEKSGFIRRGVFPGYEPGEDMLYMTIERR